MRIVFFIFFLVSFCKVKSQTLGGNAVYNFLNLSSGPVITAAGGVNISYRTNDVSIISANPALLNPLLHSQVNASFNNFPGGIKTYSLSSAFYSEKASATFGGHIYFIDYGSIPRTDASGNILGNFHPTDYTIQCTASKQYLENWTYGITMKFISSNYQQYVSSAVAFDAGILYNDSLAGVTASVVAKNMGLQLKTYGGTQEDLPFDLEIGITKRLSKSPFGFSLTAQHAHQFNILYNDTAFNNDNNFSSGGSINKILNHFVLATHIYIGNNLEAILGYNHLRRNELNIGSGGNGLNGFSAGIRIIFQKIQISFSRANYQRNIAYNQLGLSVWLNKLIRMVEL